jgi:hypothetical protein
MDRAVKKRAAVWAAWATCMLLAAFTVAAIVVDFLPGQSQPLSLRISDWLFTAVAVPFAVVGALIVVHRPSNRLGGLLLVGALALGVEKVAQELVQYGLRRPGVVPAMEWIGWVSNWALPGPGRTRSARRFDKQVFTRSRARFVNRAGSEAWAPPTRGYDRQCGPADCQAITQLMGYGD